jgi:hypothetical protein
MKKNIYSKIHTSYSYNNMKIYTISKKKTEKKTRKEQKKVQMHF